MNRETGTSSSLPWLAPLTLLAAALLATYLIGLLLWPFLPAIATAAVIGTLAYPLHRRLNGVIRNRDLAALASTILISLLVLVPMALVFVAILREVRAGIDLIAGFVSGAHLPEGALEALWADVAARLDLEPGAIGETIAEQLRDFLGVLATRTFGFISGFGGWIIQAGAAIFTLYYLLRDGERLLGTVKWLVPLDDAATERLIGQAHDVIFATVYGNVVVAMTQGALGGLAFWAVGLPAAPFWGTVMAILSLLPVVGATLVWLPGGALLIVRGEVLEGILLLAFGALVISTVDNYLRALVVGGRAQLHPLVVLFSVLGGIVLFGAVGIFIGPVLFAAALSVIEMARLALGQVAIPGPGPDGSAMGLFSVGVSAGAGPGAEGEGGRSRGVRVSEPEGEVGGAGE